MIYTFKIDNKKSFTVQVGSYFSTQAQELDDTFTDYESCGQAQDRILPLGSDFWAFWTKWDKKHLQVLTASELEELDKDIQQLKRNHKYIESDRFADIVYLCNDGNPYNDIFIQYLAHTQRDGRHTWRIKLIWNGQPSYPTTYHCGTPEKPSKFEIIGALLADKQVFEECEGDPAKYMETFGERSAANAHKIMDGCAKSALILEKLNIK